MIKEISKSTLWGMSDLTLKTGLLATQCAGSVVACVGETHVLCTISTKDSKVDPGFMPLTVNYREMFYAAGKIPGGFIKREGRVSDRETLISRLIDRSIRPLFPKNFRNETQIICTVLSYDPEHNPDIIALVGALAALSISGLPTEKNIAAIRIGMIEGDFVINPSIKQMDGSDLDLILASSKESIMMVESGGNNVSDDMMIEALEYGQKNIIPVIELIESLKKEINKKPLDFTTYKTDEVLQIIQSNFHVLIEEAIYTLSKQERSQKLSNILEKILEYFSGQDTIPNTIIEKAFQEIKSQILRKGILYQDKRLDGRKLEEIRHIECMNSVLPRAHGSTVFTRGETQALVVTTLGCTGDEQIVSDITIDKKEKFMLHYSFPPYSVGEVSALRAPTRREIGHGKLAERSLMYAISDSNASSYVVRITSEITSCNGSSSMATICGASMSLMDAGITLKSPIGGIAMGLVIDDKNNYKILSDITADEDMLGDMDFKVAGTKDGITGLQMDIKVAGITFDIIKATLKQARKGLIHILDKMSETISSARSKKSIYAPQIEVIQIDKEKIAEVIGSGGKVIQGICETSGAKIDISKTGDVNIAAPSIEGLNKAISLIKKIVAEPEIGTIYTGKVVKILASGAFVNYMGNKDGFLHISEIAEEIVDDIRDYIDEGDTVKVKLLSVDRGGRTKLTMILNKDAATSQKPTKEPTYHRETYSNNIKKNTNKKSPSSRRKNHDKSERTYFGQ